MRGFPGSFLVRISLFLLVAGAVAGSVGTAAPLTGDLAGMAPVAPYKDPPAAGTPNWGSGTRHTEFLTYHHTHRVRQTGEVEALQIYMGDNLPSAFQVRFWRLDGSTFDLVGTTEDLVSQFDAGAGTYTIHLDQPVAVEEGDFVGYYMGPAPDGYPLYAKTDGSARRSYLIRDQQFSPGAQNVNFQANQSYAAEVPIGLFMAAPDYVFLGDSITQGAPANRSFLTDSMVSNIPQTIEYQFRQFSGASYQNMGIGSQSSGMMLSRFQTDVVDLSPKNLVLLAGVNDIALGVSESTYLSNMQGMLDAAAVADINTYVFKILPWSNGTATQMQKLESMNASLETLAAGYDNVTIVDANAAVGQYRPGGPDGNLWDIKPDCGAGDGVHFNGTGHGAIAAALWDAIGANELEGLVNVAPYHDPAVPGALNWKSGGLPTEFLTYHNTHRIRQTGEINAFRVYVGSAPEEFQLRIWRQDENGHFDMVGTSADVADQLSTAGVHTISLEAPIEVREGDFIGYYALTGNDYIFHAKTDGTDRRSYLVRQHLADGMQDFDFIAQSSNNYAADMAIEVFTETPPQFVFVGDSLLGGRLDHYSFISGPILTNIEATVEYKFAELAGVTYQNMAGGSETAAGLRARFVEDVVDLNPEAVVMLVGVNDVHLLVPESEYIADMRWMLDTAEANGITPYVFKILPWTSGTPEKMANWESFNASLESLVAEYESAVLLDATEELGQEDPAGPAGNLWDIKTEYDSGNGVHINEAARAVLAQLLFEALEGGPSLPGDLNGDGSVNSGDLDLVRGNWGQTVAGPGQGDATGDGIVNSADLDVVRSNWGATRPGAVPEPVSAVLLVCGLIALGVRRNRAR